MDNYDATEIAYKNGYVKGYDDRRTEEENIMNHDNCLSRCEVKCEVPMPSMTDTMREVSLMARDVLQMTRRINAHLFGNGNPLCDKEVDPSCFREELEKTRCELLATIEELHKISSMIGV